MRKFISRLASGAAIVAAAAMPQAHASTIIDFEGDALAGLYLPGDSFSQGGFRMTANYDFGIVGTVADLGSVAPSGNATQFYFNSNDGYLTLATESGAVFSLDGFSAAFVPLIPAPVPNPTIVIVAVGIPKVGSAFGTFFGLGTSATTSYPFLTYNNPADFGRFNNLVEVQFFACVLDSSVCATPTLNDGQFALDNIGVTAIPEPTTWVLMALGLAGLAVRSRRTVL